MRHAILTGQMLLVGCARTQLAGDIVPDGAPPTSHVVCRAGDPPFVLSTSGGYGGLATDGAFVYGSALGNAIWSISVAGGEVTPLWPTDGTFWVEGLVAADDGVYANVHIADPTSPSGDDVEGVWLRHDGLASRSVHAGTFAPPYVYFADGVGNVESSADGTSEPIQLADLGFNVYAIGVTDEKLYVTEWLYGCDGVARIDRWTAAVEAFDGSDAEAVCASVEGVNGPNAVCSALGCMLDDRSAPIMIHDTVALDDTYAYTARDDGLHRVALRGNVDELVTPLRATGAAVANGCIYVQTNSELVRIAAPP